MDAENKVHPYKGTLLSNEKKPGLIKVDVTAMTAAGGGGGGGGG